MVLAGGRGTRLGALAHHRPKPLVPVLGRPMITWHLEQAARAGVRDVVLAAGHLGEQFVPALGDGSAYGVRLRVVIEPTPLGTGGGLRHASAALQPNVDTVLVLNGDQLTEHDLPAQLAAHRGGGTLHVRGVADARPYGLVEVVAGGRVAAFVEKPTERRGGLVNAGTYVLDRGLIESLPAGPRSLEREGFAAWAAAGRLTAYRDDAWCQDLGTPAGLITAHQHLSGQDVWIDSTATVEPGARLSASIVLAGARVAAGARLTGCVVAEETVVPGRAAGQNAVIA